MEKIELSTWERILLLVGDNPGCNKVFISKSLDRNYVSMHITITAMIKKGILRTVKDKGMNFLYVEDNSISILDAIRILNLELKNINNEKTKI